jgi:putative endonuclease
MKQSREARLTDRRRRYRRGVLSEWLAAGLLAAKGYRIVARRFQTPAGEIDLIAVRGRRLAFVEVKRRKTMEAAELSITPRQRRRIRQAADIWLKRHPRFATLEPAIDLVFIVPGYWPRHIRDAFPHERSGW